MRNGHGTWSVEREFASQHGAGQALVAEILGQMNTLGWQQREIFSVHLALEEALINAIKHGNRHDASKSIRVQCHLSGERIRIEVADEGPGFQPSAVPDPTKQENLLRESGRGILLMRSFMNEVVYNDAGNCVAMELVRG